MAIVETRALFEQLTILLTLATLSHLFFRRFHQPTLIAEIVIGIVLGPSVLGNPALGPYRFVFDPTVVATLAVLGSIFLLFLIGLDSDFRAIYTARNVAVASGGVVLPLVVGSLSALYLLSSTSFGPKGSAFTVALFVGAALTATSVAITAAILLEFNLLKERVAQTILGAAVVDDVLGLIVLSVVLGTTEGRVSVLDLSVLLAEAVGFLVLGMALGVYLFRRIVLRVQAEGVKVGLRHGGFIIAMAITFLFAFTAESIGLSAIVGAFLAGSLFANTPLRADFSEGARYLGAIFTPIFFVSLGLQVDFSSATGHIDLIPFAIVLMVVAILAKVAGCGIPARLGRMTMHEALAVGWGMTPRGEVGLIVAVTALSAGVIGNALFSMIVLVLILVSILPTPLFKRALDGVRRERGPAAESPASAVEGPPGP
ncbi:MAG TPA: cation:proton antiporter [Thermoplasmata archaeon]|nr:cation:proton antiporter [Thermoplasmata archaeon]